MFLHCLKYTGNKKYGFTDKLWHIAGIIIIIIMVAFVIPYMVYNNYYNILCHHITTVVFGYCMRLQSISYIILPFI